MSLFLSKTRKAKSPFMVAILACALLATGCARQMSSNVVSSSAVAGKVIQGTVLYGQAVTIKDLDSVGDSKVGAIAGGLGGAVAGSSIGKGTGQGLAAIGAGLLGAAAGSFVEDKLRTQQGMQYVVKIDPQYIQEVSVLEEKRRITFGDESVDDQIKQSIGVKTTSTDLISVTQGNDVIIQPGQKVLVIYNNDRPRVVAY